MFGETFYIHHFPDLFYSYKRNEKENDCNFPSPQKEDTHNLTNEP